MKILQIHRDIELEAQSPVSATAILERYYGKDKKMLLEVFKEHNDKCRALIGKEYVEGTIRKFDTSLLYMKQYLLAQYRKEDIETVKLIYHLVKERGMTLPGARQRMKDNKETTLRNFEIVDRLKAIREELLNMKRALDGSTYEQVEELKKDIQQG